MSVRVLIYHWRALFGGQVPRLAGMWQMLYELTCILIACNLGNNGLSGGILLGVWPCSIFELFIMLSVASW